MSDVVGVPIAPPTDDELDKLELEVAVKRQRVVASLTELRKRVVRVTSWRQWIAGRPLLWITVAASLGFVVGSRGGGPRRRPFAR